MTAETMLPVEPINVSYASLQHSMTYSDGPELPSLPLAGNATPRLGPATVAQQLQYARERTQEVLEILAALDLQGPPTKIPQPDILHADVAVSTIRTASLLPSPSRTATGQRKKSPQKKAARSASAGSSSRSRGKRQASPSPPSATAAPQPHNHHDVAPASAVSPPAAMRDRRKGTKKDHAVRSVSGERAPEGLQKLQVDASVAKKTGQPGTRRRRDAATEVASAPDQRQLRRRSPEKKSARSQSVGAAQQGRAQELGTDGVLQSVASKKESTIEVLKPPEDAAAPQPPMDGDAAAASGYPLEAPRQRRKPPEKKPIRSLSAGTPRGLRKQAGRLGFAAPTRCSSLKDIHAPNAAMLSPAKPSTPVPSHKKRRTRSAPLPVFPAHPAPPEFASRPSPTASPGRAWTLKDAALRPEPSPQAPSARPPTPAPVSLRWFPDPSPGGFPVWRQCLRCLHVKPRRDFPPTTGLGFVWVCSACSGAGVRRGPQLEVCGVVLHKVVRPLPRPAAGLPAPPQPTAGRRTPDIDLDATWDSSAQLQEPDILERPQSGQSFRRPPGARRGSGLWV
eukprot:EG_transcript_5409